MDKVKYANNVVYVSIIDGASDRHVQKFYTSFKPFTVGEVITVRDTTSGLTIDDVYEIYKCEPKVVTLKNGQLQLSYVYYVNRL